MAVMSQLCIGFKMWFSILVSKWIVFFRGESSPAAGHWRGRPLSGAGTVSVYEACWHQAPQTDDSSTPDVCGAQQGSVEARLKRWRWQIAQRTGCSEIIDDTREKRQNKQVQTAPSNENERGKTCTQTHNTHSFQTQDGLFHTTHIGDMVFIGTKLSLLDSFINACHHLSGYVCSIVHTWGNKRPYNIQ